jgi:hypothetical protein
VTVSWGRMPCYAKTARAQRAAGSKAQAGSRRKVGERRGTESHRGSRCVSGVYDGERLAWLDPAAATGKEPGSARVGWLRTTDDGWLACEGWESFTAATRARATPRRLICIRASLDTAAVCHRPPALVGDRSCLLGPRLLIRHSSPRPAAAICAPASRHCAQRNPQQHPPDAPERRCCPNRAVRCCLSGSLG